MAALKQNCFICGKTVGKTAIKNHILKEHNSGDEACYLIKAEGANNKNYCIFFTVALDSSLYYIDKFLRAIWCECCGHMSAFRVGVEEFSENKKISTFNVGDVILYEYDFGTTTEITVAIVAEIQRPKQKEKIQLASRNEPPNEVCEFCGAPATQVNSWEYEFICDKCVDTAENEGALLPLVNSPRCGACAYEGELDIWIFDPDKPFPQPQKPKAKREKR